MTTPLIVTEVLPLELAPEAVREVVKRYGPVEEPVFTRKRVTAPDDSAYPLKGFDIEEGERAAIRYVSTRHVDRDKEILMPEGCVLDEFEATGKSCLWGHEYRLPPIGSDQWIKKHPKSNPVGILAKTIYAETARAEEVFQLVKAGHLRTSSVGFITLESLRPGDDGWHALAEKLKKKWPEFEPDGVRRIITKWLLLEHSDVSVPANPHALTVAVAKSLGISEELQKEISGGELWTPEVKAPTPAESKTGEEDTYDADKLVEGIFISDEEAEKNWYSYEEVLKPYPNEHACRLHDPNKYSRFRRNNNRFGDGIHAIFGRRKTDGKSELQAIRFDKSKFTVAQAKKWLKDHDHKCIRFEPASNRDLVIEELSRRNTPVIIEERKEADDKNLIIEEVDNVIGRMKGKV